MVFFACLGLFNLVLFRRGDKSSTNADKRASNLIYLICGTIIMAVIAAMIFYAIYFQTLSAEIQAALDRRPVLFVLETVGIFAFAISWLVKGKTLTPLKAAARKLVE